MFLGVRWTRNSSEGGDEAAGGERELPAGRARLPRCGEKAGAHLVPWLLRAGGVALLLAGEAWVLLIEPAWLAPAGALICIGGAVPIAWAERLQ